MNYTCKKCGSINNLGELKIKNDYLPNGGFHRKAYCGGCGAFFKNLPHAKSVKLYFGKHRNKIISVVAKEDPEYLKWLVLQDIKPALKSSIIEALEAFDAQKSNLLFRFKISD